jgi:asparagine synthase (glutamine-hydrolysing)
MSRLAGLIAAESREKCLKIQEGLRKKIKFPVHAACQKNCLALWSGWQESGLLEKEDLFILLDGEIFNQETLGFSNDLDCLESLYRREGLPSLLEKINGDFALALFDFKRSRFFLARDRVGVKPLYYAHKGRELSFASQPGSLRSFAGLEAPPRPAFLAAVAGSHYRFFDHDRNLSPYEGILQLPAGHYLLFEDGRIRLREYWRLEDRGDSTEGASRLQEVYRELLEDSVKIRLKKRKAVFTLSGGMDSSSILSLAGAIQSKKQEAFSTVYADRTYDESEDIKTILEDKVSRWHPIPIESPELFSLIKEMLLCHEEPVATATWLSHYLLGRELSLQGRESLFGGLGGDELNAGEYEYFFYFFADLKKSGKESLLEKEIAFWKAHHDHPIHQKSAGVVADFFRDNIDFSRPGFCPRHRKRLLSYAGALDPDFFSLEDLPCRQKATFSSFLKTKAFEDIFYETAPCCLRAEDRHSAHFAYEHFLPFYDYRLLEFMFQVPGILKIQNAVTKFLLRESMRGILPESTRGRIKKTGWNAPAHLWFSGKNLSDLKDLIHSASFRQRGIYNPSKVEGILEEHENIIRENRPRENHMMFLWQLVNLELWLSSLEKPSNA